MTGDRCEPEAQRLRHRLRNSFFFFLQNRELTKKNFGIPFFSPFFDIKRAGHLLRMLNWVRPRLGLQQCRVAIKLLFR